jgi:hypothetical protein
LERNKQAISPSELTLYKYRGDFFMEKPMVNCSVSNCKFWDEGNKCGADTILIEIDSHANNDYRIETGTMIGEDRHRDQASSVANTCCHTFRPRAEK